MSTRLHKPSASLVVATAALLVAIGGTAIAAVGAIPADGRFTACYQASADLLNRIVLLAEPGEQCPGTYARVTWPAQVGGGAGPPGPAGPQGPQGAQGPVGPRGPAGLASRGSATAATVLFSVVERRVVLHAERDAVARCPKGARAVGGGGLVHTPRYEPRNSRPLVENRAPVGWAFLPEEKQAFRLYPIERKSTERWTGLPPHKHTYATTQSSLPTEKRGFARSPADVTVYAICVRTVELAKPRTGKSTTRSGG